jgi:hypothetical protein
MHSPVWRTIALIGAGYRAMDLRMWQRLQGSWRWSTLTKSHSFVVTAPICGEGNAAASSNLCASPQRNRYVISGLFADVAVDPSASPDWSTRWGALHGCLRSAAGHRAAFSRSISRKIAWPARLGEDTAKAAKSSGSSSRVTRKAPRPCRRLMRRILAAAKVS